MTAKRAMRRLEARGIMVKIFLLEYADDISALLVADNDEMIQMGVNEISPELENYFSSAGLAMNPDKSEIIMFRTSPRMQTLTVKVGDQEESQSVKLLGLTVEKGYKFHRHAKNVAKAVNYKVTRLAKVIGSLSKKVAKNMTESLVHSTIYYLLEIYGHLTGVQSTVQKSLNNGVRLITGASRRDNIERQLNAEGWLNLPNMYRLSLITTLRRVVHTGVPLLCIRILTDRRGRDHDHHLRDRGMSIGWHPEATAARQCFLYQSVMISNQHRITGQHWGNMSQSEIRSSISNILRVANYNGNV